MTPSPSGHWLCAFAPVCFEHPAERALTGSALLTSCLTQQCDGMSCVNSVSNERQSRTVTWEFVCSNLYSERLCVGRQLSLTCERNHPFPHLHSTPRGQVSLVPERRGWIPCVRDHQLGRNHTESKPCGEKSVWANLHFVQKTQYNANILRDGWAHKEETLMHSGLWRHFK